MIWNVLFKIFIVLVLVACTEKHAGTGLETSTVQLSLQTPQGTPAAYIQVLSFPSGVAMQTNAAGQVLWDTTGQQSLYAGGYRQAVILASIPQSDTTLTLAPTYSLEFAQPLNHSLVLTEAPHLMAQEGATSLQGVPAGTWNLVELSGENQQSFMVSINASSAQIDSTFGEVNVREQKCGLLRGIGEIAPADYCWFTKADTVLPGDSVNVVATGGSLQASFFADSGFGTSSTFVSLGLRFGPNRVPVDLSKRTSLKIHGNVKEGDSIIVSVITYDGALYGFWNQMFYGKGTGIYELDFQKFTLSTWSNGKAPITHAIGFDFSLPNTSRGEYKLQLDSLVW